MKIVACMLALLLSACVPAASEWVSIKTPVAMKSRSDAAPSLASTASDPRVVNRACKVDADCDVKDVGNCCGAYPQCVNKDAQTDPAKVRAQCASEHRVGTCHVMAVSGCSCEQGQCADVNAADMHKTP